MESAIIMEYKHKEKKSYINVGMEKNGIQYSKINNKIFCKNVQDSILQT